MKRSRASKDKVEVSLNERCPCGTTRKSYAKCCRKRKFKWVKDNNGTLYKQIALPPKAIESFSQAKAHFKAVMGRLPRKNDPIFLASMGEPAAHSEREILKAMKSAQISPEIIYTFIKTGRIVTDPKALTPDEQVEYEDAIDDYFMQVDKGASPADILDITPHETIMRNALIHVQTIFSYYLQKHSRRYGGDKEKESVDFFIDYSVSNIVRALRAIETLLDNSSSYEAFFLIRSLYENYIIAKYVAHDSTYTKTLYAQIGLEIGTHTYGNTAKGKTDYRILIEIATQKTFELKSIKSLAFSLDAYDEILYQKIYDSSSAVVHSRPSNIVHFVKDKGLDYLDQDFTLSVLINTHLMCFTLARFLITRKHQTYLQRDIHTSARKSLIALAAGMVALPDDKETLKASLRECVASIATGHTSLERLWNEILRELDTH